MSASGAHYKFTRVYWAFKCPSGNLFLWQPGGGGPPTCPKWLLPPHYPGLKLKTGTRGKPPGGAPKSPPRLFSGRVFRCTVAGSSHGASGPDFLAPQTRPRGDVSPTLFRAKEKHKGR